MGSQVVSVHPLGGSDPFHMSDKQILEEIYSTHVHGETKFDVDSLFTLAGNIIDRSTHVVDNVVQGNHESLEQTDNVTPPASFTSPLCTLKQITSEMSCKPPGVDIAHKTTLAILDKLSSHSWVGKAVLTLAAFAFEYGELWLLSQHLPTEPLAKSLALIKRVPELTKPSTLPKRRKAISDVNDLVRGTWDVMKLIVELERLSSSYDTKDVRALAPALEQLPLDVYWAIITIVAIVTQIDCLIADWEKRQELIQFSQKVNIRVNQLGKQISLCKKEIEDREYLNRLGKMFQTPTEIMEAFKMLIFGEDIPLPPAPIYDGATKKLVSIEVLKKKELLVFISTLDIAEEEISIFNPIYDQLTKIGNQYKIVWVPIVKEWNDQLRNKFESLKSKMPWYVLHHFTPIKGIKYLEVEWQFKKKPLVVVLNPQSKILHHNAFHIIQVWGFKGFPFTEDKEISLSETSIWINNLFDVKFDWEETNVIIYGGKNKEWIQEFNKLASALANDANIKEAKISIELFCLEDQRPNFISNFWKGAESLLVTKMRVATNTVTKQVEKLLFYKNDDNGWALLTTKGPIVVFVSRGNRVLKTVAEFDKWKEAAIKNGFEDAFKEYLDKIPSPDNVCSHLEIHNDVGKIPNNTLECAECHRTMEVFTSYWCCHGNTANNVEH